MSTFVRVAEIWVPDSDGYLLEFGGGVYGDAPEFGAISRSMCFGRGEGLPGRVWEEGPPVILKDLQGSYFQRAAAAEAARLTCAVAFPVFFGDLLKAVVVLFCGSVGDQSGAIEVWRNDPRVTTDMTLRDGVYGVNGSAFEAASRQTFLPRGSGLPGLAWQRQTSVFMDGLTESTKFLRAEELGATGIRHGFATPCPVPTNENYVLTFLSAPATPIATRIESWVAGVDGQSLTRGYGVDELGRSLPVEKVASGEVDPTIFEAFAGGIPRVRQSAAAEPGRIAGSESEARLLSLIALPVVNEGAVVETVAMYF
jgi:hypothetical protein